MKIKRLERNKAGRYEVLDLFDKVNEIIDMLNDSFITDEPDVFYSNFGPVNLDNSLSDMSCDRLTPLANETTCELTIDHLNNIVEGGGIYDGIKCPKCGARYFTVGPSTLTTVYYPTIIKDGVNINPDRNKCTTQYECCDCGHVWKETE